MKRKGALFLMLLVPLILAGCAKMPEEVMSPSIRIDMVIDNNIEKYLVRFSGGIRNSNGDICFTDCRGSVLLNDPKSGNEIYSISFDLPVILPLGTGILDITETVDQEKIMPLLDLLEIDREVLGREKTSGTVFIDREKTGLKFDKCLRKDIIEVLKGRTDENN